MGVFDQPCSDCRLGCHENCTSVTCGCIADHPGDDPTVRGFKRLKREMHPERFRTGSADPLRAYARSPGPRPPFGDLYGIPVLLDVGMPADVWEVRDKDGNVLYRGKWGVHRDRGEREESRP